MTADIVRAAAPKPRARRRNAPVDRDAALQIIDTIHRGISDGLGFASIVERVGDQLCSVVGTADLRIMWYEHAHRERHDLYIVEHGRRLTAAPEVIEPAAWQKLIERRVTRIGNTSAELRSSSTLIPGTDEAKSGVAVRIVGGDRVLGEISVENHEREHAFSDADVRLLETVAASMGVALENARLFDETQRLLKETEQRNAELAVINSIQQGLVAQLDLNAIIDLVGDELRKVFRTGDLAIGWFDEATFVVTPTYVYEHGRRIVDVAPFEMPRSERNLRVVRERIPVSMPKQDEGGAAVPGTRRPMSDLRAPVVAAGRVIALVNLDDFEHEHAFDDDDTRLLTTVCAAMGMALQSAQLFDETQRLLKETEQRAAELAVINGAQEGMAESLDFAAIAELVGEKLRTVLAAESIGIEWLDYDTFTLRDLYSVERGRRIHIEPEVVGPGERWSKLIERGRLNRHDTAEAVRTLVPQLAPGTELCLSRLAVPINAVDRRLGTIVLENFEREYAFSDNDTRMVQTIASSMGVALQSALRFDETQRLLKETEQRAAELAVIASVQEALADRREMQQIYEAVGDRIRAIFPRADVGFRVFDVDAKQVTYPYFYQSGERIAVAPSAMTETGISAHVFRTGETIVIHEDTPAVWARYGSFVIPGTRPERSGVFVPLSTESRVWGLIHLLDMEREHAFGDADVGLLETIASSMSVALDNARLFAETQRRAVELDTVNRVSQRLSGKLDLDGLIELVGEQVRMVFRADMAYVALLDRARGMIDFPYRYGEERASIPYGEGLTSKIIDTGQALILNGDIDRRTREIGATVSGREARSYLGVPIVVEGTSQGVISVQSAEREGAYDANDQRLLETIAANVGVALQNARLFDETKEALERQTATADVLQVISGSMADAQPVFEKVLDSCEKLFDASDMAVCLARDGLLTCAAHRGPMYDRWSQIMPYPLAGTWTERAMTSREVLHVEDASSNSIAPYIAEESRHFGNFSAINAPMIWQGQGIGSIDICRSPPRPFTEAEIALAQTFADQAVIAIQNARQFNETQEALEQQTASAEVLRAISNSVSDASPVFDTILDSCARLFDVQGSVIALIGHDGDVHLAAMHAHATDDDDPAWSQAALQARAEAVKPMFPMPLAGTAVETAIRAGRILSFPDVLNGDGVPQSVRVLARAIEINASVIMAPLMHAGRGIGAIALTRRKLGDFDAAEKALLADVRRPGRDRDPEHAAVQRGPRCTRRRRDRERSEERVPRDDEPRDPHADERRDRDERPAARHRPRRRAARLCRHDPRQRRCAADDHQRHPRLLEDRGGPDGHRVASVRPARLRRVGARSGRGSRGREAARPRVPVRRRRAGGRRRRRHAAAADPAEPAVERDQVHGLRRGRADGRGRRRRAALRGARHRHRPDRRGDRPAVPEVQPGRQQHDAQVRRHRPRSRDQQVAGRADGRIDGRRQRRSRSGLDVPLRDPRAGRVVARRQASRLRRRAAGARRPPHPRRRRQRDQSTHPRVAGGEVGHGRARHGRSGRRDRDDREARLRPRDPRHAHAGRRRHDARDAHPQPRATRCRWCCSARSAGASRPTRRSRRRSRSRCGRAICSTRWSRCWLAARRRRARRERTSRRSTRRSRRGIRCASCSRRTTS